MMRHRSSKLALVVLLLWAHMAQASGFLGAGGGTITGTTPTTLTGLLFGNGTNVTSVPNSTMFGGNIGLGDVASASARLYAYMSTAGQALYGLNNCTTGTCYGGYFASQGTSTGTNSGIYAAAFGGTNNRAIEVDSQYPPAGANNYSLYNNGPAQSYFKGNVGIGTASPIDVLHLHQVSATTNYLIFTNTTTGTTSGDGTQFGIDSTGNAYMWNRENLPLYFGTNNTSRMVIAANGAVTMSSLSAATGTPNAVCQNNATKEITVNAAVQTCTVSSRDVKHAIHPAAMSGLALIHRIEPSVFIYNDAPERQRWGFIAEDLQAVDSKLADGYTAEHQARSIDMPALLAVTIKAIQEQQEQILRLREAVRRH